MTDFETFRPRVHGIVSVSLEYLLVRLDTEKERITVAWFDAYAKAVQL